VSPCHHKHKKYVRDYFLIMAIILSYATVFMLVSLGSLYIFLEIKVCLSKVSSV